MRLMIGRIFSPIDDGAASLSGRGHALEGKAVPKLSLSQRGAS